MTKLPASVAVIVSVLAASAAFAAEKTITLAVQHMTCAEPMTTALVERHDALMSNDMPPRAIAKMMPLPVPRPAAVAKASTPKTAARVAMPISGVGATFGHDQIGNTAKPKRPTSTVTAQPVQAADSQGRG